MFWSFCSKVTRAFAIVALASILAPMAAADTTTGEAVYSQTCVACHGTNGKGAIPGVGDFTKSDGPLSKSDEALIASIRDGLATPGKPLSMPAKGGNPSLTDEQVKAVLMYLRTAFGDGS